MTAIALGKSSFVRADAIASAVDKFFLLIVFLFAENIIAKFLKNLLTFFKNLAII